MARKISKKLKKIRDDNSYVELLKVIPSGEYCYHNRKGFDSACPYWDINEDEPEQLNGYCHLLQEGDWEDDGYGLLWDQCKACGIGDTEYQMLKDFILSLDISEEKFYNWLEKPSDFLKGKRPCDLLEDCNYEPLWNMVYYLSYFK